MPRWIVSLVGICLLAISVSANAAQISHNASLELTQEFSPGGCYLVDPGNSADFQCGFDHVTFWGAVVPGFDTDLGDLTLIEMDYYVAFAVQASYRIVPADEERSPSLENGAPGPHCLGVCRGFRL